MWLKSVFPFQTSVLISWTLVPYLFYLPPTYPSYTPYFVLFGLLGVLELVYQKTRTWLLCRNKQDLSILLIPSILLLFYYQPIIQVWSKINSFFIHLPTLRARYYLPFTWVSLIILFYLLLHQKGTRAYLVNVFLGILCTSLCVSALVPTKQNKQSFSHRFIPIPKESDKAVILLILDEYASPTDLARYQGNTRPMQFSQQLAAKGWQVFPSSISLHKATVNSLASLFHYHLNATDENLDAPTSIRLLRESPLLADLAKKGVQVYNGGIFDLGNTQAHAKIYYYEREEKQSSFIKYLFAKSLFSLFYLLSPDAKQANHNRFIVEQGAAELIRLAKPKTFVYLHLLMPHLPLYFKGSKSFLPNPYQDKVSNYLDYWHFTNQQVYTQLIRPLVESQQFKIILTGDHGYRFYPEQLNPYRTMTAYYGFSKEQTRQVKSVQDLGSLIYASY